MRRRDVVIAPEARADLMAYFDWIADRAGPDVATTYIGRLETFCQGLAVAPQRGRRRDDIRPGLRAVGFERRVMIAFVVDDETVTILRLFSRGRDWETDFH